jgi:hypothetical protein
MMMHCIVKLNNHIDIFCRYVSEIHEKLPNEIYISDPCDPDEFTLTMRRYEVDCFILMEYKQRLIVKFLFNDGFDACQITQKVGTQCYQGGYTFSTVEFWIGEIGRGRKDVHDARRPEIPSSEHIIAAIQQVFDEDPFESARSRAETLHISHSTVGFGTC